MSKYQELLAELEGEQTALAKSLQAGEGEGDANIAAAAAEGGGQGGDDANANKDEPELDADGKPLVKSLKVTLANGDEATAIDAEPLLKAMDDKIDALGKRFESVDALEKGLDSALTLIKGQQSLIKSLVAKVDAFGTTSRGRTSVLSVTEKPNGEPASSTAARKEGELSAPEFLAKANAAFDGGALSGLELTTIDVSLRSGRQIEPGLAKKVVDFKSA